MNDARSTAHEPTDDTYCTVSQAAAFLGVSRVSIWRWIRDGHLPAVRVGQRITRIRHDDLERTQFEMQKQTRGSRSWPTPRDAAGQADDPHGQGPVSIASRLDALDHAVLFYESDAFLLDSVTEYIGAALRVGDAGLVVATRPHRDCIARRLRDAGLDLDAAQARGDYTSLDAAATLSQFMVDRTLDATRFAEVIGDLLESVVQGQRRLRVFGEMVSLLVAAEHYAAAVRLEERWSKLQRDHNFSLLCAYPIGLFGAETQMDILGQVCAAHDRVIPAESYTSQPTERERLRAIVGLQQKARWFEDQMADRHRARVKIVG